MKTDFTVRDWETHFGRWSSDPVIAVQKISAERNKFRGEIRAQTLLIKSLQEKNNALKHTLKNIADIILDVTGARRPCN